MDLEDLEAKTGNQLVDLPGSGTRVTYENQGKSGTMDKVLS